MILIHLIIGFVALIWYLTIRPLSYWKRMGVRQSKNPLWLLGDGWRNFIGRNGIINNLSWMYKEAKPERYVGIYEMCNPVLVVVDPELIKTLLVKDFDYFTDHFFFNSNPETDPLWANNLLILKGQKWREMRSILSPSFTSSKMKIMFDLVLKSAENFLAFFTKTTDDVIEMEMKDVFSRFANDVMASTAFGLEVDSLKERKNSFYLSGKMITAPRDTFSFFKIFLMKFSLFSKIFGFRFIGKEPSNYFTNIINDAIKQREKNNIKRPDMLNMLLEARANHQNSKNVLTNEVITAQALIFFFAGFDTVSTAFSFSAFELAVKKDIQDKLRKEIQETAKENEKLTYDVIQNMPYLDMFVNEILRKWTPFSSIDRVVTKTYTLEPVNKNEVPVHLKPGQSLIIPLFPLHRDPEYWPEPDKFDPERFSQENKANINPYAYIPFGVGPRVCIGNRFALMEIKTLLFKLLLKFEILPTNKTVYPPELESSPTSYQPVGGFWLGFKPIKIV